MYDTHDATAKRVHTLQQERSSLNCASQKHDEEGAVLFSSAANGRMPLLITSSSWYQLDVMPCDAFSPRPEAREIALHDIVGLPAHCHRCFRPRPFLFCASVAFLYSEAGWTASLGGALA